MKYLKHLQKNKTQKIKSSILKLKTDVRELKDCEIKIRKDFRGLKGGKIKIEKELEVLSSKSSILFTQSENAFHQKSVPLPRPSKLALSEINISSTDMDEFEKEKVMNT